MTVEDLTGPALEPDALDIEQPEGGEPVVAAAAQPARAAAAPRKRVLVPLSAVQEERIKAQRFKDDWQRAEDELADLRARQPIATPQEITEADIAAAVERADADGVKGLGEVARIVLETVAGKHKTVVAATRGVQASGRKAELKRLEDEFKAITPEFDEVLRISGMWAELRKGEDGLPINPVINKKVFEAANPAQRLFELASGKLEAAGLLDEIVARHRGTEVATEPGATAQPVARPAARAGATAEDIAAAERRGAQQVAQQVADQANRPRGIRNLTAAGGPPRVAFDKVALDELASRNPAQFTAVCEANPGLEDWWLAKTESHP